MSVQYRLGGKYGRHTFAQTANSLPVNRGTVFVDVGHQELSKMLHDRATDAIVRNPFYDRFGLYVAKFFQRNLLQEQFRIYDDSGDDKERHTSIPSTSSMSLRSSYCFLVRILIAASSSSIASTSSGSSLSRKAGMRLRRAARCPRLPPRSRRSRRVILASAARRAAVDSSSSSSSSFISASEYLSRSSFGA